MYDVLMYTSSIEVLNKQKIRRIYCNNRKYFNFFFRKLSDL